MYKSTTHLLPLALAIIFLEATAVFGQAPTFNRIITDQPNYNAELLSGVGLQDGGSLMIGTGLLNTSDPLAPSFAIGLYRFDRVGDLLWSKALPESNLLNKDYWEPYAAQLTLVDDLAYMLAVSSQVAGSAAYPMSLRKINPLTGAELSIVTLEADDPRDSLGPPVAFAVIDDAAVVIRDDYERYPRTTESTVQVFGLDDGQLRVSVPKERYNEENATAWPAAGLVFIAGPDPFGIDADGEIVWFPLSVAQSPESGVQPFVALGDRAVYAATTGAQSNNVLVTATTDGTNVVTAQVALPSRFTQGNAYDLSAWGLDSFAMTIRGQDFSNGVFLFDANGSGGLELLGYQNLLIPHYIDGPKYAVLAEQTKAPKQRRVLARRFWSSDPLGLVNYVLGDTVALPRPLSSPRPEFFDEIFTATQAGSDEILGYRSLFDQPRNWIKFNRRGDSLALPQGASMPRFVANPRLTRLPDGRGFLLYENSVSWFKTMAYLYDDGLVLQDSVEMASWGEDFFRTEIHPGGGVVYTVQFRDRIEVRHLTPECTVLTLATFDPTDFVTGSYFVSALAIGPQQEIALLVRSNSPSQPDGQMIVQGSNGTLLLNATLVQQEQIPAFARSPSGSLLIYGRSGGNYREFKPEPDGSLRLSSTGQLSTDSFLIANLLYLSEAELLVSYTDLTLGMAPYAALARYIIPEREFRIIHVESEESYAYTIELSEERKIMQSVRLLTSFQAVLASQGSISSTLEPRLAADAKLMARSPFTNAIYFSLEEGRTLPVAVEAKLFDVGGRLVHQALAEPLGAGQYHLQTPSQLPVGTYILQLDGRAAVCVKQ